MITENVSNLQIHKLTQAQYDTALSAGSLDQNALYLTPDDGKIPASSITGVLPVANGGTGAANLTQIAPVVFAADVSVTSDGTVTASVPDGLSLSDFKTFSAVAQCDSNVSRATKTVPLGVIPTASFTQTKHSALENSNSNAQEGVANYVSDTTFTFTMMLGGSMDQYIHYIAVMLFR